MSKQERKKKKQDNYAQNKCRNIMTERKVNYNTEIVKIDIR